MDDADRAAANRAVAEAPSEERVAAYNYIAMLMDQGANMSHGVRYLVKDRGLDANTASGYLVDYMVTEAGQRGFVRAEVKRRNMAAKAGPKTE